MGAVLLECRHSLQLFLGAGGIFVYSLLEAARFASVIQTLTLLTFTAPGVCRAEQRGVGMTSMPGGLLLWVSAAWVPQLWGAQSAAPEHGAVPGSAPQGAGSQALPALHHNFPGKEVVFFAAWHFLRRLLLFFKADDRSYLGKCGVALVWQVCSLDIMLAVNADAAFEQFTWWLCAWHCCRAAASATLETPLQHFDIYFWAKQVVPTPISLLCQGLLWPQPVFIPNFCLWGEKLIRKFKAVRSYLKLIPLSATWRRNFCANYHWRTANSVAIVN